MVTPSQEAAVLRTLRDIECGHIILRCSVRRYDEYAGQRLAEPELEWTTADREPAAGYPRFYRPATFQLDGYRLGHVYGWWMLLAERGWIRPPTTQEPSCWQVTNAGREAVARMKLYGATGRAEG